MKDKYIQTRIEQCKLLSKQSTCPRRKIAAMLVDPETNSIVADGYNGPPRGAGELCGGDHCNRDTQSIKSGTSLEVGCHHAELNCILNAARTGNSTTGKVLIVTAEPCLMCAKAIHHAGIKAVYIVKGGYSGAIKNGVSYLQENEVKTIFYDVSSSCLH